MRVAARSRCILSTGVVILYLWWFAGISITPFGGGHPTDPPWTCHPRDMATWEPESAIHDDFIDEYEAAMEAEEQLEAEDDEDENMDDDEDDE